MLIEAMGPSGAGKSAIIDHATSLRSPGRPEWISPAEAERSFTTIPRTTRREALDNPEIAEFARDTIAAVTASRMRVSQVVTALSMLADAEFMRQAIRGCAREVPVLHDELLLHRAFSSLPYVDDVESASMRYFRSVPLPDAAVVVGVDADVLVDRVQLRRRPINIYRGLDAEGIRMMAHRAAMAADIGAVVLAERGVPILRLETTSSVVRNAQRLHSWVAERSTESVASPYDSLREQLMEVSQTFQKVSGRYERRHRDVAYCSFHTRRFSVLRDQAQRDSVRRLTTFGVTRSVAEGRSVLDLGCYTGGMLLQASNLRIRRGLGIEYDAEKAQTARQIADLSALDQLEFRQGDVDALEPVETGTHDIVFCLAIEAHVKDPDRLYWLLGQVTSGRLCFEGNGSCDVDDAVKRMGGAGFRRIRRLGISDDDIDPRNHNRPILVADR